MPEQVLDQEQISEEPELEPGLYQIRVRSMLDRTTVRSEVEFEKRLGATLEESAQLFGAEVVHSYFIDQAIIRCQGRVRSLLDKNSAPDGQRAAIEAGQNFRPGVIVRTRVARDPVAELAKQVIDGKLTMEQLEEQLRARLTELKGAA